MLNRIRNLVAPPVFAQDDDKTRLAGLLNAIVWMLLGSSLTFSIIFPLLSPQLAVRLLLVAPLFGLLILLLILIRRGQLQLVGRLLVVGTWSILLYTAILNGGVFAPAYGGMVITVLIAGLVLGRRAALFTAATSIAAGAVLAYFNAALHRPQVNTPESIWLAQAVFFLVAALLLHLGTHSIGEALALARAELGERRRIEAAEERRRVLLETVVPLGKAVTQVTDWQACLKKIYEGVWIQLGFDRVGVFIYDPISQKLRRAIGTDRNGRMQQAEELMDLDDTMSHVLTSPAGFDYTEDFTARFSPSPTHEMYGVKHHAVVAAWAGEKPVGILAVDNFITGRPMQPAELEALKLFAGYAGLALENARHLSETADALAREQQLNKVAHVTSSVADIPTLLETIVHLTAELINADAGWLGLLDPTGDSIFNSFTFNLPPSLALPQLPKGHGISWQIIETRQSLLTNDYPSHPRAIPNWVAAGTRSYLGVPLIAGDECLGVLGLMVMSPGKVFSLRDKDLIVSIGRQAGLAIQNTQRYQQARQQAEQLDSLNQISQAVSMLQDLPDLLELTYQLVRRNLPLDAFFVGLYDAATGQISFPITYDGDRRWQEQSGPLSPESHTHRVIQSGQPILLNRALEELAQLPPMTAPIGDTTRQSASLLFAPLQTRSGIIGVISAQSYTPNAYTSEDLALLTSIAHQIAVAIENTRLFEAEQRRVALLTALYETGLDIHARLSLPILLRTIFERALHLYNVRQGGLYILQPDGLTLDLVATAPPRYSGNRLKLGEGVAGRVAQSGEPLIIANYSDWPGRAQIYKDERDLGGILSVPIKWHTEILGVLNVVDERPNRFQPDDLEAIRLLAAQAAVAIQNARLFEAEQQRVKVFAALHEIGLDLNSQLDLPILLRTIMEKAAHLLNAPMGGLYLMQPDGQTLQPVANLPAGDISQPVRLGEGLVGSVAQSGVPLVVADYMQWPGRLPSVTNPPFRAVVGVPIKWQDESLGVVSVCDMQPGRFGVSDAEIVRLLASQAAVAIQNAQLFDATRRQLQELTLLQAVALAASQTGDEDELIERATAIISDALFQDYCGVLLLNPLTRSLWVHPSHRGMNSEMKQLIIPVDGRGVTAAVVRQGEPRRIADVRQEPAYWAANPVMRSELCVPLKTGERVIGVLNVESPQLDAFSLADERLLVTIAGQLATTIERLRVEAQLHRMNLELERRVADRTAQLKAANQELESFSYSVSHDLRAPLRGIDGFSQALLEDYGDRVEGEGRRYLQIIRQECQRMGQLIDDLINLARVARVEMYRVEVNLSEMVEALIAAQREREPERQVAVSIEPALMIYGDFNLLRIMLNNLLSNAWKFTAKQPLARIQVGVERTPGQETVFFIRDNGAGFDMTYANKLFGAFQRLHSQVEFEGTGIGLATVQRIINRHGGRIWAEAAIHQGATFYFSLPAETTS